jgi:outer membrane murein-binding lipoprotein Lpp
MCGGPVNISVGEVLTIIGIVGSFIGAVVVVAVLVGGERKRIDILSTEAKETRVEVAAIKAKVDGEATKVAVLQQSEQRYQRDHAALSSTLATLTEQVHAIALSNARIEAALKKE